jgi:hypothetical protein
MLPLRIPRHLETSQLHNTELKKLVHVLRGVPTPSSNSLDAYHHTVKDQVRALPCRLQQSVLSRSTNVCPAHRGLHHQLITEMWSWVQHEFNGGIGKHIYPVIMGRKLSAEQEHKVRQLEPVLQMWRTDFRSDTSAPPGRDPIPGNSEWSYQIDQCPACMLTRIGSDKQVLFALYAGMIGRFPKHKLSSVKLSLEELTVHTLDNPKSKRIRFVRYWLKASTVGDTSLLEATNLGIVLKKLYREWKRDAKSNRPSIYGIQYNLISMGESHQHTNGLYPHLVDPKIGPQPRSNRLNPHSPLEHLGFKTSSHRARVSTRTSKLHLASESITDSDSDSTVYPEDSISQHNPVASLGIKTAHHRKRQDYVAPNSPLMPHRLDTRPGAANLPDSNKKTSRASSSTYRSPTKASGVSMCPSHIHTVFSHSTDRISLASTATTMSYDREGHDLPVPQRQSMYFGYGYEMRDPFEDMDEIQESDDEDNHDNNDGELN